MLKHHADFTAHLARLTGRQRQVGVVDQDAPLFGDFQAVDAADQRRLAGAGRATQHDAFAFAHFQVDALEYMKSAVVLVQPGDIHDYLAGVSDWRHGVYVSRLCEHGVSPVISENARRYRAQGR